jgi:hypothetical protein
MLKPRWKEEFIYQVKHIKFLYHLFEYEFHPWVSNLDTPLYTMEAQSTWFLKIILESGTSKWMVPLVTVCVGNLVNFYVSGELRCKCGSKATWGICIWLGLHIPSSSIKGWSTYWSLHKPSATEWGECRAHLWIDT